MVQRSQGELEPMAEHGPHYLGYENAPVGVHRDARTAAQVAERYLWLVDRVMSRLAVWWPDGVDLGLLRAEATISLRRVSASAQRIEDVPDIRREAVIVMDEQLLPGLLRGL